MNGDSTCTCEPYPIGEGPDIACPIHGKYPLVKVRLVSGEGILLDFSEHLRYLGLADGDIVYLALHTRHPLEEEREQRSTGYPQQSVAWSSSSAGPTTILGISVGDASAPEPDDEDDSLPDVPEAQQCDRSAPGDVCTDPEHWTAASTPPSLRIVPGSLRLDES